MCTHAYDDRCLLLMQLWTEVWLRGHLFTKCKTGCSTELLNVKMRNE